MPLQALLCEDGSIRLVPDFVYLEIAAPFARGMRQAEFPVDVPAPIPPELADIGPLTHVGRLVSALEKAQARHLRIERGEDTEGVLPSPPCS